MNIVLFSVIEIHSISHCCIIVVALVSHWSAYKYALAPGMNEMNLNGKRNEIKT